MDTTVLCGAIRKDGLNRKILQAARFPEFYHPVISRVCLFEFIRNAANGIGKGEKTVTYNQREIEFFLYKFLNPIMEYYTEIPVNSVVGRYSVETVMRENRPIGDVLVELSPCSNKMAKDIASSQEMSEPLRQFDQDDFHVWVTAIREECHYIVITNSRRFPSKIGRISRVHPVKFYQCLNSSN